MPKPFIQCPPDVKVTLAAHQSTAHVKFAHPKSNVDRRLGILEFGVIEFKGNYS